MCWKEFVILATILGVGQAIIHPSVCVTATSLNFRTCGSPTCSIIGTQPQGTCFGFIEKSASWVKVQFTDSQVAYAHGDYLSDQFGGSYVEVNVAGNLNIRSCPSSNCAIVGAVPGGMYLKWIASEGDWEKLIYNDDVSYGYSQYLIGPNSADVPYVSRSQWGAKDAINVTPLTSLPLGKVFIHHTAGPRCSSQQACVDIVKGVQDYHLGRGWDDIGYNFLVGEDGRVYEGRGWKNQGAHSPTHNVNTYGIALIGNFENDLPNESALEAVKNLIIYGTFAGYMESDFKLFGHRDAKSTACPGQRLYDEIKTWSHYSNESP